VLAAVLPERVEIESAARSTLRSLYSALSLVNFERAALAAAAVNARACVCDLSENVMNEVLVIASAWCLETRFFRSLSQLEAHGRALRFQKDKILERR
jgi:hypothetical protein